MSAFENVSVRKLFIFSEFNEWLKTKFHTDDPWVNLSRIRSRKFDLWKTWSFVGMAYFPYLAYNESFENLPLWNCSLEFWRLFSLFFFFTHLNTVLSELLWSLTIRLSMHSSIHNFLVNTLASTNIDQSAPNLVKMYMTIRSRMSSITEVIGPKLSKL